jgi:hypothetical protein
VLQEIINQPGWAPGNALVILFSGTTGKRVAEAYEDDAAGAAVLHIEYNNGNTTLLRLIPSSTPTTVVESPTPSSTPVVTSTETLPAPTWTLLPTETLPWLPTETPTIPPTAQP